MIGSDITGWVLALEAATQYQGKHINEENALRLEEHIKKNFRTAFPSSCSTSNSLFFMKPSSVGTVGGKEKN
jgi:hypothetical protein